MAEEAAAQETEADHASAPPLYSALHVGIATLLGGPLGGAVPLAINYQRLGRPRAAWLVFLSLGVTVTAALATLVVLLPGELESGRALAFLGALFTYQLARVLQGTAYDAHRAGGGVKASGWAAAGWGALALALIAGTAIGLATIRWVVLPNAVFTVAASRYQDGDLDGAVAAYTYHLRIDDSDAAVLYNRGLAYFDLGDYAEADADFTAFLERRPGDPDALFMRGLTRLRLGRAAASVSDFDAYLRGHPKDAIALYDRGLAREDQGDLAGAIADFEAAARLAPDDADVREALERARFLHEAGDRAEEARR